MDKMQTIIKLSNAHLTYDYDSLTISSENDEKLDVKLINDVFEFLSLEHAVVFSKVFISSLKNGAILNNHLHLLFPEFNEDGLSLIFKLISELSDVFPLTLELRSDGCEIIFDMEFKQALLRNSLFDSTLDGKTWLQIVEIASQMAEKYYFEKISTNYYQRFLSQNFTLPNMLRFSYKWQFLPVWERYIVFKLANDQQKSQLKFELPLFQEISSSTLISLGMKESKHSQHFEDIVNVELDPSGEIVGYNLKEFYLAANLPLREDNLINAINIVKNELLVDNVCFRKIGICASSQTFESLKSFIEKEKHLFYTLRLADLLLYEGEKQIFKFKAILEEAKTYIDTPSNGIRKFIFLDYEMIKGIANSSSKQLLKELVKVIFYHKATNTSIVVRTDVFEHDYSAIYELDQDSDYEKTEIYEKRSANRVAFLKKKRKVSSDFYLFKHQRSQLGKSD